MGDRFSSILRIISPVITSPLSHEFVSPTSMNSMYLTMTSVPMNLSAIFSTECSLYPALITAFTLTFSPANLAASMPRNTVSGVSLVSPIAWNVSTSNASSETVTLSSPDSASSSANFSRSRPFVVIAKSNSFGSILMKSQTSLRRSGSPPVSLIFCRPKGTKDSTTNASSS